MSRLYPLTMLLAIVASLGLSGRRLYHQVADRDLDRAAEIVRATYAPGDLIIVDPPFMVGPRERLGDLTLLEPRTLVAQDLEGFTRVRLLSLRVLGERPDVVALLGGFGRLDDTVDAGDVTLRTFSLNSPARVVFDMRAAIHELAVSVRYADGVASRCDKWDRDRWVCPRDPGWSYVGRETLNVDSEPRDCVWAHPLDKGGVLHIELPPVSSTSTLTLAGGLGFALEAANRVKAPVHVVIASGDDVLLALDHDPGAAWQPYETTLPLGSVPTNVEVSTRDNGAAHFCMSLYLLEGRR